MNTGKHVLKVGVNWTRTKKKKRSLEIDQARELYKEKQRALCNAIFKAKEAAWNSLLQEINKDSWGLAYKVVINKLRSSSPIITELLDPISLKGMINDLFPQDGMRRNPQFLDIQEWNDDWNVLPSEVHSVLIKRQILNTAPGPDGICSKVWKQIPGNLIDLIVKILNKCIKSGIFFSL